MLRQLSSKSRLQSKPGAADAGCTCHDDDCGWGDAAVHNRGGGVQELRRISNLHGTAEPSDAALVRGQAGTAERRDCCCCCGAAHPARDG